MSALSDEIEADRSKRSARKGRKTRKEKTTDRRRPSKPGGITLRCGCRWLYSGGAWRHVTPHRGHPLRALPITDQEMNQLLQGAAA